MINNKKIIDNKLNYLSKSKFRSSFKLSYKDKKYVIDNGIEKIIEHAYIFVNERLGLFDINSDGK